MKYESDADVFQMPPSQGQNLSVQYIFVNAERNGTRLAEIYRTQKLNSQARP